MASKDTEAALQFMAGLIGGYAGGRERKQDRKRRDQQDEQDRQWREWQQRQAELERQDRIEQARLTREEQARDNARQERQWSQERIDRMTDKEENRSLQLELRGIDAAEREKYRKEQLGWRQEDRDYQRNQDRLNQVNAELDDLERKWNANGGGFDNTGDMARQKELILERKQLLSGVQTGAQGAGMAPGASRATMPATQYDTEIEEAAKAHGLDPKLMKAVMWTESHGNPNAVSPKGAKGLFQFMPATAKYYRIDPTNPQESIWGAAAMLSDLSKRQGGDISKILAGYNWGEGNMQKKGMENMPKETRDYIANVNSLMGVSPTDNSFVSNLAKDSGLTEEPIKKLRTPKEIEAERHILERQLQKATDAYENPRLYNLALSDRPEDIAAAQAKIAKEVQSINAQLDELDYEQVPHMRPPAPEPTVAAGADPATAPKDTHPQAGLDLYGMLGYNRVARNEGFETKAGQSVNPTGAFDVMKALEKGLMSPIPNEQLRSPSIYTDRAGSRVKWDSIINAELQKDPILKYSGYSLDNFMKYREANPNMPEQAAFLDFTKKAKASVQPGQPGWQAASSGEAVYPRNPIDPLGMGLFVGVGGPGMVKPPMELPFMGGRGGGGMGWQAEKSFAESPIPDMFGGASSRGGQLALPPPSSMGHAPMNMGARTATEALGFPGVRTVPPMQSPANPLSWLDSYVPPPAPPVRPPLALPAPPPQGSVIPLPGQAPLPYNIPVNPMDIELLRQYMNSQRLGM